MSATQLEFPEWWEDFRKGHEREDYYETLERKGSAVRFVSGDADLSRLAPALQRIALPVAFPDAATPRLLVPLEVRCRGTIGCAAHVTQPDAIDLDAAEKK